ncbi:MAG TPA: C4-type zinc ribbon domain-containing protein [Bacteroidota bacterium]|nr:C4-type zinc ribbon domain-containing protein [Bacteroidota bacterium]
MENRLRALYALQIVDLGLDDLQYMKGDLPQVVEDLSANVKLKLALKKDLEETLKKSLSLRDQIDTEILSLKERIEKYKTQQFQVKTNKQYDALAREVDQAQERITKLQKEMEMLEGKAETAKQDAEALAPQIETMQEELVQKKKELAAVNKEHEDEELKLKHKRDKLASRLTKADQQMYERIRNAKDGKAIVPLKRNSCGGCYNRVPPQKILELRTNTSMLVCERCGRVLISDSIVESVTKETVEA